MTLSKEQYQLNRQSKGMGVCPWCGSELVKVQGWGLWLCQNLGEDHIVQVYVLDGEIKHDRK